MATPLEGAVYLGVAQAATDWSIAYLKDRKPPLEERSLAHMAGMQYQLAEMVALNEASRALVRSSAEDWMAQPWTSEETAEKGSICKYITTNNHVRVVNLAMDIAGGPGIYRRFGLERLYRDVRAGKAQPLRDACFFELDLPKGAKAAGVSGSGTSWIMPAGPRSVGG